MDILLVEDDLELGSGVRTALADQGFAVIWVRRIAEANQQLERQASDVVILDLGLPDGDGLDLLKQMRRNRIRLPVLILTARDTLTDRLTGLDSGADDYLIKPFALAELVSRIRALARRSYSMQDDVLELRGLTLHESAQRVTVYGKPVELSLSEFLLLSLLMRRADRVVTRRLLEQEVLPGGQNNQSNVLDVHVSNLRKKIGDGYVRTVRGVGYVIERLVASGADHSQHTERSL
jgi:two-component system, OmpR family, response regulator QseB